MGGIFSKPKEVDYDAIARKEAEKERIRNAERNRRGVESTIRTSYNGVAEQREEVSKRKKLLGE